MVFEPCNYISATFCSLIVNRITKLAHSASVAEANIERFLDSARNDRRGECPLDFPVRALSLIEAKA